MSGAPSAALATTATADPAADATGLHGWRWHAVVMAMVTLATLVSRAAFFGDQAAGYDEQLYSLVAQRMLAGDLLYVDIWDRKSVGLFAIFAFAHLLGGDDALAYQLFACLFAAVGGWLVYLAARPLADRLTACGAAMLYPPLIALYGSYSGQAENFFIPLVIAAFVLVTRLDRGNAEVRAAAAMAFGGLALQVKFTVAPQCLLLGALALWHFRAEPLPRLAGRAAAYALIGLAPTLLVTGYYAAVGHFDAYWYASVASSMDRAPSGGGRFMAEHLSALAPMATLALAGIYAAFRLNPPQDRGYYRLVGLWGLSALAGIYLPGTLYLYYYAAFVPMAILLALPFLDRRPRMGWLPLPLALLACLVLLNIPLRLDEARASRQAVDDMALAIRSHVDARSRCLLIFDGPMALQRLSGGCLPSRIVYSDHWNNLLERDALGLDRVAELQRVLARRPGAIITADDRVTEQDPDTNRLIRQALAADYVHVIARPIHKRTYHAWVLRDHRS
ncbi:ArnT family glycosyltransferase [Alteraurantiacibacter buctensis]|uniref:Glycosyltransferase RgtA/B/C/D-like domain-containing protein n=1 Tax=Alteraurantiacibacter buctensis TaxID=1503981 RepID=A0A844Z2A4_9SPHN|nr:glycosyltransferase family 39 protein [Alteraurantiacibacter buctensis]MXO72597.1 hypothetical protein [Alteraurantiacibacter buctensis]